MSDLAFHGVKVGMLVGQNPTTRREHADRIADAIAAAGGQGGFAHTIDGADSFAANCVLPAFATDDASLVEAAGGRVVLVDGPSDNLKVTTPSDLIVAAALASIAAR